MRLSLHGVQGYDALFGAGEHGVLVNTRSLTASVVPYQATADGRFWLAAPRTAPVSSWEEIARHALDGSPSDVTVVATGIDNRAYTVPRAVSSTARTALQASWRDRPGITAVGRHVASILSSGNQVTRNEVTYLHRFFKRNTEESAGVERWRLWGGNFGRNWVQQVVTKNPVLADASTDVNLLAFYDGNETERTFWAERSGENALGLYRKTPENAWLAWGNGDWLRCDAPTRELSSRLVELDDDTAVYVASALYDAPDTPVSFRNLDPEEWDLVHDGLPGVDWDMVELAMKPGVVAAADGQYTPEERSKNAGAQLRDKNGRFAMVGGTGRMRSGLRGEIVTVNPVDRSLIVRAADGRTYPVAARDFEVDGEPVGDEPNLVPGASSPAGAGAAPKLPPLNLKGILGQPRATSTTPKAWMRKLLQPMGAGQLKKVVNDYERFIEDERRKRAKDFPGNHPRFAIEEPVAEAVPPPAGDEKPNPDNTDVKPLHLAIVDRDDPQAVTDLVSLVPAATTGGQATAYRRVAGEWVEDVKVLQDMRSPTPPPVVQLDDATYHDVLQQVDSNLPEDPSSARPTGSPASPAPVQASGEFKLNVDMEPAAIWGWAEDGSVVAILAAGGADRNRGDAERLRRYWTHGEGAAKIRWGTPGDFNRCVKHLEKYMPGRAKGYCDLRHKEATGEYPATHARREKAAADVEDLVPPPEIVDTMTRFEEMDDDTYALTAAGEGGLDRNRGNAEKLRRYWLYGKGALKIRWNTPGDWTRCVRQLEKYLGPRAKGYCALRHHEATGMWTGDRRNRQEHSLTAGGETIYSTQEIRRTNEVLLASADRARALSAKHRVYGMSDSIGPVPREASDITEGRRGRSFTIPLVIPEGLESGDGRTFQKGSLSMRSLPLPLLWQIKTGDGHDGAFVVGRVDRVERTEDGLGNASGVFDTGPYGEEAQRLVESRMLRWVSADLDRFEADEVDMSTENQDKPPKLNIKKGRLMGITLVAKPAFQECTIQLDPLEEAVPVNDGTYVGETPDREAPAIVASSGIAAAIPVEPPRTWFDRPILNGPTPINVTDEGQVFGHVATWDVSHIGLPNGTRAPRSASNYAYFHTGVLRTLDGVDVNVGQLTLAGGHADLRADAAMAVKHYDDTGSAVADVHAGEDAYGIWVAGALRPGTKPEQVRALRASAPSGDWRVINGRLELVAVCQVNVPGFPVTRAQVASGAVYALVAAGTETLARMHQQPMDELSRRIAEVEQYQLRRDAERRQAIMSRMEPVLKEREQSRKELENLAASAQSRVYKVLDVDGYLTEFKDFSPEKRKELAGKKHALKDGSFPIENVADLRRAIRAYGRASEDKKASVRRHIIRRARGLGKPDMIPKSWSEASLNDLALLREDSREVITAAALANRADATRKRVR